MAQFNSLGIKVGSTMLCHIIPKGEELQHTLTITCRCNPKLELIKVDHPTGEIEDVYLMFHVPLILRDAEMN